QQVLRNDLRILIMSATIDVEKLATLFNNAPVVTCEGRQFPVKLNYINVDDKNPIWDNVARVVKKALVENKGDVLVFLPGAREIHRTQELIEKELVGAICYALYGDLSQQQQQQAIQPDSNGRRKIVLATSIAETSLTIEGVTVVIDCGYSRVARFDLRTGLTRLETVRVTKDAADQRAGRAGRLAPGVCYRLWSEGTHLHLNAHRNPEIADADLAPLLLELSNWGVNNVAELRWVTPPPQGAVKQAGELLQQLGAMSGAAITQLGKNMIKLPAHPRIAHLLIEAQAEDKKQKQNKFAPLACDIAALLEERDPLSKESGTDLVLRIETLHKWRKKERVIADKNILERIDRLASSWRKILKTEADNTICAVTDTGKLLAAAYPERIAKQLNKNSSRYRLANGRIAKLNETDPITREEWIAIAHIDAGSSEGKIFLAAPLNYEDVLHKAELKEVLTWDNQKGIIVAEVETRIGNIIIERIPLDKIDEQQKMKVLCDAIREHGLNNMFNLTDEISAWKTRVMALRTWRPEEGWPDVSDDKLLSTVEEWLSPYLININKRDELQRIDIGTILFGILPWELHSKLDMLAPKNLKVPSGSAIPLIYFADGRPPEMAVRLQEVFGMMETPTVNEGRNKVLLHLLSPARRPVQVTQDINSFWHNTYFEVRKELRVRYPKHSWPEDPWTAVAVRGVKRKS
ncbi:MAG: ATP-dependent helicase HrpB, partial [Bacteroidia bacterium]|nr:ATP-dependent helicase HrpB [Bacteroidia bacterium]